MSRLFEEFGKREIIIDHIATSEVSVTLTTDAKADLEKVQKALVDVADVQFERGKATVSIVGRGMRTHPEVVPIILTTLHKSGIAPQLITQSALRTSLSFLVEEAEAAPAVKALHQALFE